MPILISPSPKIKRAFPICSIVMCIIMIKGYGFSPLLSSLRLWVLIKIGYYSLSPLKGILLNDICPLKDMVSQIFIPINFVSINGKHLGMLPNDMHITFYRIPLGTPLSLTYVKCWPV